MIRMINRVTIILLLAVLAVSVALIWWVANLTDRHMRAELLEHARITAQAINIEHVNALTGSEKDLDSPSYQRIKLQMNSMRKARHQCHFLYIIGQRPDGAVFFFVDSLPSDSKDYAPPGTIYEEVSDDYRHAFNTGPGVVVGPITDRWGTSVTALIPLKAPTTANLVAVLGMDIDAKDWKKEILGRCSIPFAAMLFVASLIIVLASRLQVVNARQESEEKHRLFFENAPIGIIHYDNQGIITDVNEAMINTFGSSREKLMGLDISDIPDKVFFKEVGKSLNGEQGYYEGKYTSYTGGKPSIIKANWIPILRNGGVVSGVGIIEDTTERSNAEEALKERTKTLNDILEKAADGICVCHNIPEAPYVRFTHWNPCITKITGYTIEEINRLGWYQSMYPDPELQQKAIKRMASMRIGNDVPAEEWVITTKSGGKRPLSISTSIVEKEDGKVYVLAVMRDITERKKVEDALRESEKKYKFLAENMVDIVWTLDRDFRTTYVSPSIEKLLGFTITERKQQTLEETITPESFKNVQTQFLEELQHDESGVYDTERFVTVEAEYYRKDGSTTWMANRVKAIRDRAGEIVGMHGVSFDITERKRMEVELLTAQKLESLGLLAGGLAHDFHNILTTIIGNISLAKMQVRPEDEVSQLLSEAETASIRAQTLTRQLLTFAKGGAPLKEIASIRDILKATSTLVLHGSKSDCKSLIADDLWLAEIDVGQMSQVINNLIINADQAMTEGGTIQVAAENLSIDNGQGFPLKPGKYIKISIKDQGVGIAEKHLSMIFDPYFTTKQAGSGLGLATTYSIIKKHHGHITVESQLGLGTAFHIYLPASDKIVLEKEKVKLKKGQGRILVMDDEPSLRKIVGMMLNKLGYESGFAADGAEAIRMAKVAKDAENPFDAAILDLTIPGGMGGKEAINKLLEIDPELKAIVSSGYSNDPVMANFQEYGFKGIIPKPFAFLSLSTLLHDVLKGEKE